MTGSTSDSCAKKRNCLGKKKNPFLFQQWPVIWKQIFLAVCGRPYMPVFYVARWLILPIVAAISVTSTPRLKQQIIDSSKITTKTPYNGLLVLKMVSFHNTINYLTTQINNETSFETQQRKVYYFSRSKRVRVRKCSFWCRRLVCWFLSLWEVCVTLVSSSRDWPQGWFFCV